VFVGEVGGIDLRRAGRDDAAEIERAIGRDAVLVFRDQRITDEEQIAFSALLGPLETTIKLLRKDHKARLAPQVSDVSNLDEAGNLVAPDDRRRMNGLGNRLWHTDSSFKRVPARYSLLSARAIPPAGPEGGGETEFADLRAAYDALPAAMKSRLDGLVAEHSILHSRATIGFTDFSEEERAGLAAVPQRVVRVHQGSGRKTLYLASHASHIIGMPVPEGRLLLRDLIEHATQPRFVYRHTWREGDLVMWDDRCTMHRSRPYDPQHKRDMHRTTVSDGRSTLDEAAAA
jgi:alpha-ketoglutarate-dependent 2,4-dichlorophenoxyacetate dioxygenase